MTDSAATILVSSPTPSLRQIAAAKKLAIQIPRLSLTSVIIRTAQFFILAAFSLAYAMSDPDVYLDIFVWPMNTPPPFQMRVFRNTSADWGTDSHIFRNGDYWPVLEFEWIFPDPPKGLSEIYVCVEDPRWGCDGNQWAATRNGWLDSWPFQVVLPKELARTVHIDRYIFWLVMVGGYLGLGHNVISLVHALEPSGIGFYKYSAIMDLFISIVFLLLGIFPLAIRRNHQVDEADDPRTMYTNSLTPSQQHAFFMGWALWGLYTATFLLNTVLIANLDRYKRLPKVIPEKVHGPHRAPHSGREGAAACISRRIEDSEAVGSYGRATGRERGIELLDRNHMR